MRHGHGALNVLDRPVIGCCQLHHADLRIMPREQRVGVVYLFGRVVEDDRVGIIRAARGENISVRWRSRRTRWNGPRDH